MERVAFTIGYSKRLAQGLLGLYGGAAGVVLMAPLWVGLKFLALVFLYHHYRHCVNLQLKRVTPNAVVEIWQDPKGRWGFLTYSGHRAQGRLKGESYKSPFGVVLSIQLSTRAIFIFIPSDALSSFEYRTLCARLRLRSAKIKPA